MFVGGCVAVAVAIDPDPSSAGGEHRIVVEDADSGETVWSSPVDDGDPVAVEYTHSVHKSEVIERYEVDADDDVFRSDRMIFSTYGAGMPSQADVERTDDGRFVYRTDGSKEDLRIKPGSVAGHELVVDGERHDLVEISNEKAVIIRTEDRSLTAVFTDRVRQAVPLYT
ncbi:DUF1850 domain-containing protein [Natrialbaceae archaeon GCM10025810]|uniref:DUF1850 domain-containing protein n=1 Tax=Halovalidus salilacus TaxID=3075124 RepID=UPI0036066067